MALVLLFRSLLKMVGIRLEVTANHLNCGLPKFEGAREDVQQLVGLLEAHANPPTP
jgi:hypothetical protein